MYDHYHHYYDYDHHDYDAKRPCSSLAWAKSKLDASSRANVPIMSVPFATPKLTIGMACYDDYEGVWFSVMALRLYHPEVMTHSEILVVDNHPDSQHGSLVRDFLQNWVSNGRYIPFAGPRGTAAPRDEIFRQANSPLVLCIDSHVLLVPGAIRQLIDFYDRHPGCTDLLQGPLSYDDLKTYSSHFEDEWRDQMWGTWSTDRRAEGNEPFEIPAQGLGLFSCRKEAWPGFNSEFRGFGGEEFYIHEKFRQLGRRTLCLPFLRWVHRFNRPRGVPYPLTIEEKFRNYIVGLRELGLSIDRAVDHFSRFLPREKLQEIIGNVAVAPRQRVGLIAKLRQLARKMRVRRV
jgi:hypothetical protein